MHIIIFYEHIVRELDSVKRLCSALENRGHTCCVFSGDFEVTNAYYYARRNIIDIILMPWFVDDEHFDLIYPILRTNPDIKIVNLHHEQISSKVYENVLFPHSELTQMNSYHFAWGKYFCDQLIQRGTQKERVYITGNIRNDKAFQIEYNKKTLAQHYHLSINKKWILFAENRGFASQRMNDSLRAALRNRGLSEDEIIESMQNSADSLADFFQILKNLPEQFLDQYEFIYRPHPGTQIDEVFPKGIHVICELPIYEWIVSSDLFVTCESTSIYEAEVCGIPCVTYNNKPARDKFRMAGLDRYPSLNSLSEINDEMIIKISQQQRMNPIYEDYLGKVDGHAVDRAVNALEEIGKKDTRIDFYGHKCNIKMLIRRYLYEITTRVVVKANLLDAIKFPRSSYWSSRDIPYTKENIRTYFSNK